MAAHDNAAYFTVFGSGIFPVDMLRYDQCWPYQSEDAAEMIREAEWGMEKPLRSIVLMSRSRGAPTIGRWQSMGWRVVLGIDRQAHKATIRTET